MEIPADAWILVADGKKALLLRNDGDELYPNLHVIKKSVQDNPATHAQGTDKPGSLAGSNGIRSAAEPTDWHQQAEDAFAAEVAEMLYKRAHADQFEKIILVAPPNTLGELRKCLHAEVSAKVIGELHKDLTKHPVSEIEQIIGNA